jgi:hypothetical protein
MDNARHAERFTARVLIGAALYGVVGSASLYFTAAPDPHRLLYFAFAGIALVFQGVFVVIARDPRHFAALLPLCVFEKISFAAPALAFYSQGQAPLSMGLGGAVDLLLAGLFAICWRKMARTA